MKAADKDLPVILFALLVAAVPYAVRLPIWVAAWSLFFWAFAFLAASRQRPAPKAWVSAMPIPIGLLGVLISNGWELDGESFVGMLAIMVSLKPLEIRTQRDKMITIFLAYFVVLTHLLYDTALFMAIYTLVSVCITTAALIQINHRGAGMPFSLMLSACIMIQALALTAALFLIFPRFHGHFWGGYNPVAPRTGFSERLSPGGVSSLAQDSAIAFRVDFEGRIPPPERLYWRGIVFWKFTGQDWERGNFAYAQPPSFSGSQTVQYTVSLEPHHQRWWFALDLPVAAPPRLRLLDDFTLVSWRPLTERAVYTLRSQTAYHAGALPFREAALDLPPWGNGRARNLAREWLSAGLAPEAIVEKALAFFRENRFSYTLKPPPLKGDGIDDFLFRTRKGYCEHFASAFAFLMRSAQIPARIVGGYLGGERNPFGNYLIVRQSDAHAWVEIWLLNSGWTRVDPTSAIAPARVRQGAAAALAPEERPIYLSSRFLIGLYHFWKPVQFAWDRINSGWNFWVVGYSGSRQRDLLANAAIIHGPAGRIIAALLILAIAAAAAWGLFYWGLRSAGVVRSQGVQQSYERFCRKLARATTPRRPEQGPVDYARQVAGDRPDLAAGVAAITALYVRLRYGSDANKADEIKLRHLVRHFAPRKK